MMQVRLRSIGKTAVHVGVGVSLLAIFQIAVAQRTLLFEDFEDATPGPPMLDECASGELPEGVTLAEACIGTNSIDTYNRSRVQEEQESRATVTGGDGFPDPFDPGNNQSLVMHNPHQSTQMAVNFFSIFPDDTESPFYYLRNGVIQFDAYLEAPQPDSLFTFFGVRFGWQANPDDRNQVATTGDVTVWNVFNLYGDVIDDPEKRQIAVDVLLQRASPGFQDNLYDQANGDFFLDPNQDVVAEEWPMRVRYELDGDNSTYSVSIDNLDDPDGPVDIMWPGGTTEQPWVEFFDFSDFTNKSVPGINEISFMTDASGFAVTDVSQNVYIDNLLIIDNDQEPDPPMGDPDYNNDGLVNAADYTVWRDTLGDMVDPAGSGADGDGDGMITAADRDVWVAGYGSIVVGSASGATVPEPSSLIQLIAALLGVGAVAPRRVGAFGSCGLG